MSNSSKRSADTSLLHPAIRKKVQIILDQLHQENIPFEVFEAFRTPERQAILFAQGRTTPGDKVTWVGPWKSFHQYGLAVDMVLKIDGDWSWDDKGPRAAFWSRMQDIAKQQGLTALFNRKGRLIELPHIQLAGLSMDQLYAGQYPAGSDSVWAEHLSELIDNWTGVGSPPPRPPLAPDRPALDPADAAELEDAAAVTSTSLTTPDADARFQQLHAFVRQWEGGFSNHPADNGGATNMGVTQATLSTWRRNAVTVDDVRNLRRAEADAILRTNYYAPCRCAEMPDRTAMVVYNGAVLHGPKRSIEFLQTAFNTLGMTAGGKPLEVDGRIGPITIEAARKTDAAVLSDAYIDAQEAYLRRHEDFDTFGTGWLNRLASLREFIATLPHGAGLRPTTIMKISDSKSEPDLQSLLGGALAGLADGGTGGTGLQALLAPLLQDNGADTDAIRRQKALLKLVLGDAPGLNTALLTTPSVTVPPGTAPLTPVNAALGEGIGRLLDGKKSIIGVVGLFLTILLPEIGLSGTLIEFIRGHSAELITGLSTFTGWGFLGKIDKAVRSQRP